MRFSRASRASFRPVWTCLLALCILLLAGPAAARWVDLGGEPINVELVEFDGERSVVEVTIGGFEAEPVDIDGVLYHLISLEREAISLEAGLPALPSVRRGLIIPDDRQMAVRLLDSEYVDLTDLPVAPSKGNLLRSVDPATVPYPFDDFYQGDGVFPAVPVEGDPPHIIRDFRGMVLDANAFQYFPATQTLRVFTRMVIEVAPVGPGVTNVLHRSGLPEKMDPQFVKLYQNHFLNFGGDRYTPVLEDGGLLIITYDAFLPNIQPLAAWKLQKGIETKLVTLAETGSTYSQIKNYILGEYNSWQPSYVLLVGDAAQVPRYGSDSDPGYSTLAGGDNYPELFIGRFSAENATHVNTQVTRTLTYERDQVAGEIWPQYGTGIASNQGPGHHGEYDNQHMDLIRQDLLAYGYLGVDQIYDPTATAAQVTTALNEGRGIVNYCGHGSQTSWGTTGFSNSHINALVNDNMLPFIICVACNNGTFDSGTCFAEAWLRATNGGQPTGAIACYASYISQSWSPPMDSQDEAIDLLVADQMRTTGGLWFNGSCLMMDLNGALGQDEFLNWTIFGDPSVAVRTKAAQTMVVTHSGALLIGQTDYAVNVAGVAGALCALYADGVLYGTGTTDGGGNATITMADPPTDPMTLTLTVTAYNMVTNISTVEVLPPEGPFLTFESSTVLDGGGDGDGMLDEGETVDLEVTLENVGVEAATGITGVLATTDSYVTILAGTRGFPDIPAAGFGTCSPPYSLVVAGDAPDLHSVPFTLVATSAEGNWDLNFSLTIEAPVLAAGQLEVNDMSGGNGSGNADAGETFYLRVELENSGHSDADNLTGTLSCTHADVIIHDADGSCLNVPAGGEADLRTFEVEILPTCPEPELIEFHLDITAPNGFAASLDFDLPVGGWFDDMEQDRGWTVGAAGDDATTGIWTRVDPIGTEYSGYVIQMEDDHTPAPGTLCFVTGNGSVGGAAGENDVDGGKTTLLTPVFQLGGALSAQVSYYRWYTNSWGNNPDEDWWNVDVTNDGVNWVSLEHTQTTLAAWTQFTFELTDYITLTDQVQLRFVAADEGAGGSLVEAGVDDFLLTVFQPVQTGIGDGVVGLPTELRLGTNYPNPFNPQTTISFDLPRTSRVELSVYDLTGRRVVTLVDGELEGGRHEVTWQGRDARGRQVASGLYFSYLKADDEVMTKKMVLLK